MENFENVFNCHNYENSTLLLHAGQEPEKWSCRAVIPPIVNSTTFKQISPGSAVYEYSRSNNPSRECLETSFATSENAKHALAFSSGLGATTAVCFLLKHGDHILATSDLYGGANRFFQKCACRMNISVTLADSTDLSKFFEHIKPGITKMIWIETPTNPMMNITDIEKVSEKCKQENVILVVDNTFATPVFQKPLAHGADIVLHSVTKYLNGHSDVVMGCVMLDRDDLYKELQFLQNALGIVPSPFDCFLVNRGLKTLHVRMAKHMENALVIANFLENHPKVEQCFYPLLHSFKDKEIVSKQMKGSSGMISFLLKVKNVNDDVKKFTCALKIFTLAESLGGFESLVCVPSLMTHASVDSKHRQKIGLFDNLIRLSVGIEDAKDLCKDLEQALNHI
ncbi:hypothetical protein GJ496_002385 [Pomphorhynchus laevis]|nr:hypothetical protein GJ496_002385 [Pomphorhynchus laevis]